jgi:hypothetical protein
MRNVKLRRSPPVEAVAWAETLPYLYGITGFQVKLDRSKRGLSNPEYLIEKGKVEKLYPPFLRFFLLFGKV